MSHLCFHSKLLTLYKRKKVTTPILDRSESLEQLIREQMSFEGGAFLGSARKLRESHSNLRTGKAS